MDKKIYIDEVNVSECTYSKIGIDKKCYCEEGFYDDGSPVFECGEIPDCYYKQLKRLQAENERLKNSLKICQGLCKTLEKAKANEHNHWFNRCCEINTECDKYKQAMQEISDMVTLFHSVNENKDLNRFKNNILAKINEVIGVE